MCLFMLWIRPVSVGAVHACDVQEITLEELADDPDMSACLASCKYLKGNYRFLARSELYLYEALTLCQRTGEKMSASPLDLVGVFGESVRIRRGVVGQKSTRDLLQACITDFNKNVGKAPGLSLCHAFWLYGLYGRMFVFYPAQAHKVKQETFKIIYNILRCPLEMREILEKLYSDYRHYNSGRVAV